MILDSFIKPLKSWKGMLLLLVIIGEITLTVYIPTWRTSFYGAISKNLIKETYNALWVFLALGGGLVLTQSIKWYYRLILGLKSREYLTDYLMTLWENKKETIGASQRVNLDAQQCSELILQTVIEVFISLSIVIILLLYNFNIISILAIGYSFISCIGAILFNKPLKTRDIQVQAVEASHRHALTSDSIGVYEDYNNIFKDVIQRLRSYILLLSGFEMFKSMQSNLMNLVPLLFLLPLYFNKEIGFGVLMGDIATFDLLVINATILIQLYLNVIKIQASYHRIKEYIEE